MLEIKDIYISSLLLNINEIAKKSKTETVIKLENLVSNLDLIKYYLEISNKIIDIHESEENNVNYSPLDSIFNLVNINKNQIKKVLPLNKNNKEINMPVLKYKNIGEKDYKTILNKLESYIQNEDIVVDKLLSILEKYYINIPVSSTYTDISYYDLSKLIGAISSSMYVYDKYYKIDDLEKEYVTNFDSKKTKFLLVSGEFSGIQNFIYTISSKLAMKSLRGRSFYLELFIEHIIDEILDNIGLSRINLIYSGGSHFYLLLPNTDDVKKIIKDFKDRINDFILEKIGTTIYFEMNYVEVSSYELSNGKLDNNVSDNLIGNLFKRSTNKSSKGKNSRYNLKQLDNLFNEDSSINKVYSSTKECIICKKSEFDTILEKNSKESGYDIELCDACKSYIDLGKNISKMYHNRNDMFIVEEEIKDNYKGLIFPKYNGDYVKINIKNLDYLKKLLSDKTSNIYRYYSVNSEQDNSIIARNIYIGNYNARKDIYDDTLIEFEDLVNESKGIERLAVFRADVDNLGILFQKGFEISGSKDPYKNINILRSAILSRNLTEFFKKDINYILEKENINNVSGEFNGYFNIIKENRENRKIVVVYSGGDDIFAIGTWDDILEFSLDLRKSFKEYTSDKITLSAGIGFFKHSFPVSQMAKITGNLENLAKNNIEKNISKDSVALFGEIDDKIKHIYTWDRLENKVLNEKYLFIKNVTSLNIKEENKLLISKSKWYDFIELLNKKIRENSKIDLARFAYTVARIEYAKGDVEMFTEFKNKMFNWFKNTEDAMELLTAINLWIYQGREV